LRERLDRVEDALRLFPLMWGPGSPRFEGKTIVVEEATCYPRPLQERVPILVGGSGEKRTLRLVARYADACNLVGDVERVRHKLGVLHEHCAAEGRDPAAIEVTHLGPVLPATVEEHIGRFRELAEVGVQTAIVALPAGEGTEPVTRFADVIGAFK
jgi:alkanesulfonate monooxygenase SsuD/methylene tetrahydromethanopterin reductase-like flavin-dependent oxidoreductase (luciferase family)